MKKKIFLPLAVVIIAAAVCVAWFCMPKIFGKNVEPDKVDRIEVFYGGTGVGFTIDDPADIEYIVENIRSIPLKRGQLSLGRKGYGFRIDYIDGRGRNIIPQFILNSDDTVRCDPFFYTCTGGLCFDYLKQLEQQVSE